MPQFSGRDARGPALAPPAAPQHSHQRQGGMTSHCSTRPTCPVGHTGTEYRDLCSRDVLAHLPPLTSRPTADSTANDPLQSLGCLMGLISSHPGLPWSPLPSPASPTEEVVRHVTRCH